MMPAVPDQGVSFSAAQRPVTIDYPAALALRQMALVQDELPKYLLAPEVSALLHYAPDLHRKMLLATLWNTGARINEALALTRSDFSLAPQHPVLQRGSHPESMGITVKNAGRPVRPHIGQYAAHHAESIGVLDAGFAPMFGILFNHQPGLIGISFPFFK